MQMQMAMQYNDAPSNHYPLLDPNASNVSPYGQYQAAGMASVSSYQGGGGGRGDGACAPRSSPSVRCHCGCTSPDVGLTDRLHSSSSSSAPASTDGAGEACVLRWLRAQRAVAERALRGAAAAGGAVSARGAQRLRRPVRQPRGGRGASQPAAAQRGPLRGAAQPAPGLPRAATTTHAERAAAAVVPAIRPVRRPPPLEWGVDDERVARARRENWAGDLLSCGRRSCACR